MKKQFCIGSLMLVAASVFAADAGPKADVAAAAKKLAEAGDYSWTANIDLGPNARFTPGPTEGKTDKDGYTSLSVTFNDNTSEGAARAGKVVVKTDDGWKTAEEASADDGGGGFNPARFMARRMQNLKLSAAEVQELLTQCAELQKVGDVYSADLTEAGAKALATMGFGGRRGGQAPPPSNVKGSVKFWVQDGVLSKYQLKVSGRRQNRDGDEMDFERTTTVEIKDVGKTKLDLPEEAKKKLS
jgi:hypothetical protein